MEEKKHFWADKKKKNLFIGVFVGVMVLCVLGIALFNMNNTPQKALEKYIGAINARDYEKMYSLISDEGKESLTKEAFIEKNKNIYEGIDGKNMTITKILKVGAVNSIYEQVNFEYSMDTVAGKLNSANRINVKKERFFNPYRLVWDPSVILPQLTSSTAKVSVTTEAADRGNIEDRNGNMFATTGVAFSVGLVPGKINAAAKDADLEKLASLLGIQTDAITAALSASWVTDDTFVPVKTIAGGNAELESNLLQIPGVMLQDKTVRTYPYGDKAAQLVGYIQGISAKELEEKKDEGYTESSLIGKTGLERLYEKRLRGEEGCKITVIDTLSDGSDTDNTVIEKASVSGENIKTTIDINLQSVLYDQFATDKSGSVAINPKTGEVLAMVSTPSFNGNDFVLGLSEAAWQKLNTDVSKPLLNRYDGSYVPGSSFKPVTAMSGLQTGAFTAADNFGPSGLLWQKDASWGDFNITTLTEYSPPANLENAMVYSDNIYFAKSALKIGANPFAEQLKKMGFGEVMPFDLEMATSQISDSGSFDSEAQLAASGFGQGQILVNPLHMATIYSAFVNDGSMIKPYIEYKDAPQAEYWKNQVVSKEVADIVKNALVQAVENPNGTGHEAKTPGVSIAGKTGTAEIKASQEDTTGTELGWFDAFTVDAASGKQLMVISMVEDVKDRGGSHYVIPKVKAAFEKYMQ